MTGVNVTSRRYPPPGGFPQRVRAFFEPLWPRPMPPPGTGRLQSEPVARVRAAGCLAVIVSLVVACSSSTNKGASSSTRAASTAVSAPSTSSTSSAPAGAASNSSTDPVAVALNGTLLTAAETQRALSLPAVPAPEPADKPQTPQGPLSEQGLLSVLPNSAVYKPFYDQAGGGVGANVTYHSTTPQLDIDVAVLKFATPAGAESFVKRATDLATTLAQGRTTPHPELDLGVVPAGQQVVLRVPPSAVGDPTNETLLLDVVYSNGVTYLITLLGPPGTLSDQQIIALARAQDAKWSAQRADLHLG